MEFSHKPVLLDETIENLKIRSEGIYVDGTLGGGGHSNEILKHLTATGTLIGIDRDGAAIKAAGERLRMYEGQMHIVRGNYSDMPVILKAKGITSCDGILLDLGVSSYQLDEADRGFSYMADAPLDMRMDQREARTAADIVNEEGEHELFRIIRD